MRKVSLLLVFVLTAITLSAQETENATKDSGFSTAAGRKTTFVDNKFWDNWFIGGGVGGNLYASGMRNDGAEFMSRPSLSYNLQLGKWYNPIFGIRGKGTFGIIHTFHTPANNDTKMDRFKMIMAEGDLMVNLSNYFCKYNENRFYSFIPYLGMGAAYGRGYAGNLVWPDESKKDQKSLTFNAGLINNFRVSDRFNLQLELSGIILKQDFDRKYPNSTISYDGLANVSVNAVYELGKNDFKEAVLMDQGLIDDLNRQINDLRKVKPTVVKCPECPECPKPIIDNTPKGNFISNVVFFRLGSANVDTNQEVSIYNTAQYLKDNPNVKVKVVGYADKKTGTASINDKLSEKRAKNVANALINKYNIDSNRVTVEWKGDTVQPYAKNEWNRVAIFYAE